MPRILLDENLPIALKGLLTGHDARTVRDMGWLGLSNGALLDAIEAVGFEVILTGDKNMRFQQALATRRIAVVELGSNRWQTIREHADRILRRLDGLSPGEYRRVDLPRPPLRRRPAPPKSAF